MLDKDLAFAVFDSFQAGKKIHDTMLEKAAHSIGISSKEILQEAQLKTSATNFLKCAQRMNKQEFAYFSSAIGYSPDEIIKVAKLTDSAPEEVIFTYLAATNYKPHEKFAEMAAGEAQGQTLQQDPSLLGNPQLPPNAMTSQDMMGNLMTQPSPTAPSQIPATDNGNMEQLLSNDQNKEQIEAEQQQQAADQMLEQNPQPQPPKEQIEAALESADSMAKAKYVMPLGNEDQLARLAGEIDAVEQKVQMPLKDPAQIKKLVQAVEKQDKALIDQAIKERAEMMGGAAGGGEQMGPLPGTPENPVGQSAGQPQGQDPSQGMPQEAAQGVPPQQKQAPQGTSQAPSQMPPKMAHILKLASKIKVR